MYHFGGDDPSIPPGDVERLREAQPDAPVYVYPGAGHGFNCEQRESYDAASAALARTRTLEFLNRYLTGDGSGGDTRSGAASS